MGSYRSVDPRRALAVVCSVALCVVASCGGDDDTTVSSAPDSIAGSSEVPTTVVESTTSVPTGADVESLSYLIQGLLRTEEIGNGWVDQGRQIIPPGSDQLSGFLCAEGESAIAELAGSADPQVSTSFRREGDTGLTVFETLTWGDREQVIADFNAVADAVRACAGQSYTTADLGELSLTVESGLEYGSASISYRFGPPTPPSSNPWIEQRVTAVLLEEPSQPVAIVIGVGSTTLHDSSTSESAVIDDAEFDRIVNAAVDRILGGL